MDITKLEAARRQLETALHLYFQESDPVSIHSLAAASHEVLTNISRKTESGTQMIFDLVSEWTKEEYRKEVRRKLHDAQNFFKHADQDHDQVLKNFNPEQTELVLLDACFAYQRIAGERPPIVALFYVWARLTFGHEYLKYDIDGSDITPRLDPDFLNRIRAMTRSSFFMEMFPVLHRSMFGGRSLHQ